MPTSELEPMQNHTEIWIYQELHVSYYSTININVILGSKVSALRLHQFEKKRSANESSYMLCGQ
jgi:hypothetical protein